MGRKEGWVLEKKWRRLDALRQTVLCLNVRFDRLRSVKNRSQKCSFAVNFFLPCYQKWTKDWSFISTRSCRICLRSLQVSNGCCLCKPCPKRRGFSGFFLKNTTTITSRAPLFWAST